MTKEEKQALIKKCEEDLHNYQVRMDGARDRKDWQSFNTYANMVAGLITRLNNLNV